MLRITLQLAGGLEQLVKEVAAELGTSPAEAVKVLLAKSASHCPDWCSPEPHPTLDLRRRVRSVAGFVYLMEGWSDHPEDQERLYKIGFSVNPLRRLDEVTKAEGRFVELVATIPAADMRALEARLHREHAHCRVRGEWFRLTDAEVANLRRMAEAES